MSRGCKIHEFRSLTRNSFPQSLKHPFAATHTRLPQLFDSRQHRASILSKEQPILYCRSRTVKTSFWDPLKSTLADLSRRRAAGHIPHSFPARTHNTINFLSWLAIGPLVTSANLNLDYQDTIANRVCQVLVESVWGELLHSHCECSGGACPRLDF